MGRRREAGFTLVELLVVVLLLGILTTMATPKFLAPRDGPADTARADLVAAARVQTVALQRVGAYVADGAGLAALGSELRWAAGDTPAAPGVVYAHVPATPGRELYLSTRTPTGDCWYVHLTPAAVRYGSSPACPPAAGAAAPAYADAW